MHARTRQRESPGRLFNELCTLAARSFRSCDFLRFSSFHFAERLYTYRRRSSCRVILLLQREATKCTVGITVFIDTNRVLHLQNDAVIQISGWKGTYSKERW